MLRYLARHPDGMPAQQLHEAAADALGLQDEDRQILAPSGVQPVSPNHVRLRGTDTRLRQVRGRRRAHRRRLAALMINNEVGIASSALRIPKIDVDYFDEQTA